jgi:hypothetical protein
MSQTWQASSLPIATDRQTNWVPCEFGKKIRRDNLGVFLVKAASLIQAPPVRPATPRCPEPPLTPMAPATLPPTTSGLPPRDAITSSSGVKQA